MNALDRLKMDIDDYNEVLASKMEKIFESIESLYIYRNMYSVDDIVSKIEDIHSDTIQIEKETAVLRKMESYYKLFKQEQERDTDKEFNFLEEFEKWETEHRSNERYYKDLI